MAKIKADKGASPPKGEAPFVLSTLEDRFCREMLRDGIQVRAYQRAFKDNSITYGSASTLSSRLLEKVGIKERIAELEAQRNKRLEISIDKLMKRVENKATNNPQDIVDPEGGYLPLHELDPDVAACIQSLEVEIIPNKDGSQVVEVRKYKFYDTNKADELIGRHLKAWNDVGSKTNPVHVTVEGLLGEIDGGTKDLVRE